MKKIEHELLGNEFIDVLIDENSIKYNSPSRYLIVEKDSNIDEINFQKGGHKEVGVNGVTLISLLGICINQLEYFQNSDFATEENQKAIEKIEEAMEYLNKRLEDRKKRNVYGKYEK